MEVEFFLEIIWMWVMREWEKRCFAFLPGLQFLGNSGAGSVVDSDQHFARGKVVSVLDMLNQDILRYLIVTIYRDVKPEHNNQGWGGGGQLYEVTVGMVNKRHKICFHF